MPRLIKFMASSQTASDKIDPPKPARSGVPEWYKKANRFISGKMQITPEGVVNKDIKLCVPFLDAMTGGYLIELPADLLIERTSNDVSFYWHEEPQLIEFRNKEMATTLPRPAGHDRDLYAWVIHWATILPPGYSAFVVHPLNRFDLPFMTTNGIVDADNYFTGGQIPFFLRSDFVGIIPAGTPIVQIIPFKREDWKHEIVPYDEKWMKSTMYSVSRFITGGYKRFKWQKKHFE